MKTHFPNRPSTLFRRASFITPLLAAAWLALVPQTASGQAWPTKPIKIIVPFPPGGTSDPMARIIGQKLGEILGQSFVVENKAGAGTTIGTAEVARAPADGYTLLLAPAPFVITQYVYPKLPYDGKKDFTPIGLIASSVGGTTIQQWLPPWATSNATCTENNCGWVEQLDPTRPIQYESCGGAGVTDIICPMYYSPSKVEGLTRPSEQSRRNLRLV